MLFYGMFGAKQYFSHENRELLNPSSFINTRKRLTSARTINHQFFIVE